MNKKQSTAETDLAKPGPPLTMHSQGKLLAIVAAAMAFLLLWAWILMPFFSVFAWALALAVIFFPMHRRIFSRIRNEDLAAFTSVLVLALLVIGPGAFVARELFTAVSENVAFITAMVQEGKWMDALPTSVKRWIEKNVDVRSNVEPLLQAAKERIPTIFSSSLRSLLELLLIFFTTFFFLRDKSAVLAGARDFIPLSPRETNEIFQRTEDTIYATIYGTLVVACVQGGLGGLIFWWLELPAPILWGAVMAILAIIPYLGAFVVWAPAAALLAFQDRLGQALILTFWGVVVVGLIDNLLYPLLVGKRLRFHTLPLFFFILGGVAFFGTSGLILGPLALAVGGGILQICRLHMKGQSGPQRETLPEKRVASRSMQGS